MFMGMNFKQVFENSLIARQNLSSLLKLPLTNERIEVSPNFKDAVDEVLAALPKRDLIDTKHPSLLKLVSVVEKEIKQFSQHIPLEELLSSIQETFQSTLNNPGIWTQAGGAVR